MVLSISLWNSGGTSPNILSPSSPQRVEAVAKYRLRCAKAEQATAAVLLLGEEEGRLVTKESGGSSKVPEEGPERLVLVVRWRKLRSSCRLLHGGEPRVPNKDVRRYDRVPYVGPIRVSWEDVNGQPNYAPAKCQDVSESGLCIEVPVPVSVGIYISVRADQVKVGGSARVKRSARKGSKYILGLELSQLLRSQDLAELRLLRGGL